ncbi:MAG TPA: transposase [Kofleriaceae bacterium]
MCYSSNVVKAAGIARALKRHKQQVLVFKTWGGKRRGAGRPPKGRLSSEPHKKRATFRESEPLHVNIRVEPGVGRLRKRHIYRALREATIAVAKHEDFRIIHLSIQSKHVHLIVEAQHKTALAKGMQGFQISAARHINRVISKRSGKRRTGRVFSDRYHARVLKTPKTVRNALAYVLNNWRRHQEHRAAWTKNWAMDPYSTAIQFDGWKEMERELFYRKPPDTYLTLWVWLPKTWLLREGWRRHGLISLEEVPGPITKATVTAA